MLIPGIHQWLGDVSLLYFLSYVNDFTGLALYPAHEHGASGCFELCQLNKTVKV